MPVSASWGGARIYCAELLMQATYLMWTSMSNLIPMASRVIHWASAWTKPVVIAFVTVALAWDRHG